LVDLLIWMEFLSYPDISAQRPPGTHTSSRRPCLRLGSGSHMRYRSVVYIAQEGAISKMERIRMFVCEHAAGTPPARP